ncbi:MAG: HipA domain-containing protein [Deltaproteobacteria bacterium]|nr:HipA domain-containing protein [Deltaproteobacteria bacterium]
MEALPRPASPFPRPDNGRRGPFGQGQDFAPRARAQGRAWPVNAGTAVRRKRQKAEFCRQIGYIVPRPKAWSPLFPRTAPEAQGAGPRARGEAKVSACTTLKVTWDGLTVGWLTQPARTTDMSFEYDPGWLGGGHPAISLSLPLSGQRFDARTSKNYFGNFMPEGEALSWIAAWKRVSGADPFDFLAKFGTEVAGALSIFPIDDPPRPMSAHPIDDGSYRDVTDIVIKSLHSSKKENFNLIVATNSKISLAGAQNKLPIYWHDNKILIPENNSDAPTTHIIKPESTRFKYLQFNESFCMDLALAIGLPVPESEIIYLDKIPIFIVKRYDRIYDSHKKLQRIHQEDFCQAMNIDKAYKYQENDGPGISDCTIFLLNTVKISQFEHYNFIKCIIYNYLIGNCDAHAKNFSIIHNIDFNNLSKSNVTYSLAPFYDLVCTIYYPMLSTTLAMFLGYNKNHEILSIDSLNKLKCDFNVDINIFLNLIYNLLDEINIKLSYTYEKHISLHRFTHFYKKLYTIITSNSRNLKKQLDGLSNRSRLAGPGAATGHGQRRD